MLKSIDHIVIAVSDLAQASSDYARAGFTVTPGGEHTGGATHNALVSFADSTYFELIAVKDPSKAADHRWFKSLDHGDGSVAFALLADNLHLEAERLANSSIATEGPRDGGRLRPDGQSVEWRSLNLESSASPLLPFLIQDRTPRVLRVPDGVAAEHSLGALRVAGVTIAVGDLGAASLAFAALLGEGRDLPSSVLGVAATLRFTVGGQWIDLVRPGNANSEIGAFQRDRGDALYRITLTGGSNDSVELPIELTHGVRIGIES